MRYIAFGLLLVAGCNAEQAVAPGPVAKDLYSVWYGSGGAIVKLDFSGKTTAILLVSLSGQTQSISCTLSVTGDQSAGQLTLSHCTYTADGNDASAANDSASYTKTTTALTLCDPTCGTYK